MQKIERKDEVVLALRGGLDFRSCRSLLSHLQTLYRNDSRRVALDLSQVEDLDMSGLAVLVMADYDLYGQGGRLYITGISARAQRILALVEPALGRLSWPGRRKQLSD